MVKNRERSQFLTERILHWEHFITQKTLGKIKPFVETNYNKNIEEMAEVLRKNKSVLMECYLLYVIESSQYQNGFNLLQNTDSHSVMSLNRNHGDGAAAGQNDMTPKDKIPTDLLKWTNKIGVRFKDLNYGLNIANWREKSINILSKPFVSVNEKEESQIGAGRVLLHTSSLSDQVHQIHLGLNITITPVEISEHKVTFKIFFEGSMPPANIENIKKSSLADCNILYKRSAMSTTVCVDFNDTLTIAGLYEKISSEVVDKTPWIASVPVMKYFFYSQKQEQQNTSVVFLCTPRYPKEVEQKLRYLLELTSYRDHRLDLFQQLCQQEILYSDVPEQLSPYPLIREQLGYIKSHDLVYPLNDNDAEKMIIQTVKDICQVLHPWTDKYYEKYMTSTPEYIPNPVEIADELPVDVMPHEENTVEPVEIAQEKPVAVEVAKDDPETMVATPLEEKREAVWETVSSGEIGEEGESEDYSDYNSLDTEDPHKESGSEKFLANKHHNED